MKRVLVFGSFDPLHPGHQNFFAQAKALGGHLTVVVTHDEALRDHKRREPSQSAQVRLAAVAAAPGVNRALIGNPQANTYTLLSGLDYDVLALGYDQEPSDEVVRRELNARGKHQAEIVRLKPYQPEKYKSSIIRGNV